MMGVEAKDMNPSIIYTSMHPDEKLLLAGNVFSKL